MNDTTTKKLPGSLARDAQFDSWITINTDGTILVRTGKVEIGQGITTAVAMIAAEELDVDPSRIQVVSGATGKVVDENVTSGSGSMEETGRALRQVSAEVRAHLLDLAAEALGVAVGTLSIDDGTVRSSETNRQTTYWEVMGGRHFERSATGDVSPKAPDSYRLVGQNIPQRDAMAKVTGQPVFVQDLVLDGLLHARVLRPPSYDATLTSFESNSVEALPGIVKVMRSGDFLGVIADTEWHATKARQAMSDIARWDEPARLPDEDGIYAWHIENETMANPVVDGKALDEAAPDLPPVPEGASKTLEATYAKPYIMHGSLAPSAAVGLYADGKLTIWSPSQGPYPLKRCVAASLGLAEDAVQIIHTQGSGCYGHNGADDVSFDAALLAMEVPGRPVRVQWMREDEHRWEPYSPAQVVMTRASLDANGDILDWNLDLWSTTHQGRPRPASETHSSLVADWHREPRRARPVPSQNFGYEAAAHRNARAYYDFPNPRVVSHFVAEQPLRTSSLRGLGNFANIFAIESFIDELAEVAGSDPVEFRLRYLSEQRARDVLTAAAKAIGWTRQSPGSGRGLGIAFNRYKNGKAYAAVACDVEIDRTKGTFGIHRVVVAGDCGQIVNPAAVTNQLEGGVLQAASWVLERVRFDPVRVTSVDWETYPVMRMPDAPKIETVLIDRPGSPYLGVGEGSQGPAGAAIANALYNASGVRFREMPFDAERLRAMLAAGS